MNQRKQINEFVLESYFWCRYASNIVLKSMCLSKHILHIGTLIFKYLKKVHLPEMDPTTWEF